MLLTLKLELVACARTVLPRYHWYLNGASPLADTLNIAVAPCVTIRLTGCCTIEGGTRTVRLATWLVAVPTPLLTTTVKLPAWLLWTLLKVRLVLVAWLSAFVPNKYH